MPRAWSGETGGALESRDAEHVDRAYPLLAFLISGLSTLIDEIDWFRWLTDLFGVTWHAITTVVTVFMVGLTVFLVSMGLGSLVYGSRLAQRLPPAAVWGGLQLMAGLLALASPLLLVTSRDALSASWYGHDETIRQFLGLFRSGPELLFLCPVVGIPGLAFGMTFPVGNRLYARRFRWLGSHVGAVYFSRQAPPATPRCRPRRTRRAGPRGG